MEGQKHYYIQVTNEEKDKTSLDNNSVPDEHGMSAAMFNKEHNHYSYS